MAGEPTTEVFRAELREFLRAHHPGKPPKEATAAERLDHRRAWAATLYDTGYAAPGWPKEWGGMGLPLEHQLVYYEEFATANLPGHPSPNAFIVAPTIAQHGTDEQKRRFLQRIVRGDDLWCQGWSEPGAGSDLPSLRTRAVLDGDEYRVTGQKVWTTQADTADWMFALVRTGAQEARQLGVTYLLIDMKSPGLTVRPLRDMSGRHDFSEVFFDEVRVPVDNRVGEENGGWAIARTSLGHERSTANVAQEMRYREIMRQLFAFAAERGYAQHLVVRQRLVDLEIQSRLLALNNQRVLAQVLRGEEPGPASSVSRLFSSLFEKRLHEVAVDIHGADGMLASDDPSAPQHGRWLWGFLSTRASTIGAGTAEIQRNTIAERVLGLPHEPDALG